MNKVSETHDRTASNQEKVDGDVIISKDGGHTGSSMRSESIHQDSNGYYLAGFWIRFWAYLLDLIVIGSITRLVVHPIFKLLDISLHDGSMFAPVSILTSVIFYGYFIVMTRFFSQTIGKMVFGIKVIELKGKSPSWSTIFFRELIGRFISSFFFVLYAVVAFTNKKQGIHDLFADTTVVQEKKKVEFKPAI